jgi:vesicle coat complex subunit
MAKSPPSSALPLDIPALGEWLGQDPSERLPRLETLITRAPKSRSEFKIERVRLALKQAFDQQPKIFFKLTKSWLASDDARLRLAAAGALPVSHEDFRAKSERILKRLMADDDARVRHLAIDLLAIDINEHLDRVHKWAKSPDPHVRETVVRHLRHMATDQIKPRVPTLFKELVEDPAPNVHWAVASTFLLLYEREPRPIIETIKAMAISNNESVRAAAAACFFEHVFADHFDQLLPTMRSWLRTNPPYLRWTLVRSLRFLTVTARSMQLLRGLYEDPDPEIRRRLAQALVHLYDPLDEDRRQLLTLVRRADQDPSKRVRDAVAQGKEEREELAEDLKNLATV